MRNKRKSSPLRRFHATEGTKLVLPKRFILDPAAFAFHRKAVFG